MKNNRKNFTNPYVAAGLGYIDKVIFPRETRPLICSGLEMLESKRKSRPPKKHGNIPLQMSVGYMVNYLWYRIS